MKNKGWRYVGDGRSVILSCLSITKLNVALEDKETIALARRIQEYLDGIEELASKIYTVSRIFRLGDFSEYQSRYAYKFVTEATYKKHISQGSFLVSSLERFRRFELQGDIAGDRFEGAAHSFYNVGKRQLNVSTLSGFDCNIMSLAKNLSNAKRMKDQFGPVVLQIDLRPFAKRLSEALGSEPPEVRLVRYADLKIYRNRLDLADVEGFPPNLTPRLAKSLREKCRIPSIFAKPSRFEHEAEVRIVLRANADVPDMTQISDPSILQHIRRLDN